MKNSLHIVLTISLFASLLIQAEVNKDYLEYHLKIRQAEELIGEGSFESALNVYQEIFDSFDFVFRKDCIVATQLAFYLGDETRTLKYLKKGISRGWTIKNIKKYKILQPLLKSDQGQIIKAQYDSLRSIYSKSLNKKLRTEVHEMYKKDQKMALRALFRIGEKSQTKYAEKKFAPHSEKQLAHLNQVLIEQGYPGEKLVGNEWWTSVILSHHNSISTEYNSKDSMYLDLRPKLIEAIEKGELHPYEFAIIEDWRSASLYQHKSTSYGYLGVVPDSSTLEKANLNRDAIGLRSIQLRNDLIDVEQSTGLNLYLPKGWQKGKITVVNN